MPKTPADIAAHEAGLVSTFVKDYLVGAEIPPLVFFKNDGKIHEKTKPARYRCYLRLLSCCKELWPIRRYLDLTIYDMQGRTGPSRSNALYLQGILGKTYKVKYMQKMRIPLALQLDTGLHFRGGFCYVTDACIAADLVRAYDKAFSPRGVEVVSMKAVYMNRPEWELPAGDKKLTTVLCKDVHLLIIQVSVGSETLDLHIY